MLRHLIAGLGFLFLGFACSASNSSSGVDGNSGGNGGNGGADGGMFCNGCVGQTYTPCIDGEPQEPVECEEACTPDLGCSYCTPEETVCFGNEVHKCSSDGSNTDEVVEVCDVASGELCGNGRCGTACEIAADQPSNVGCEFWSVDLDQQDALNDPASAPWGLVLSNAGDGSANITIDANLAKPGDPLQLQPVKQLTVPAGSLQTVVLPARELDCGTKPNDYNSPGTCLSSRAFKITSSSPIVVYQFNVFTNEYSNDASLLLPTSALGKVYRIINWNAGHPVSVLNSPIDRSYVTVVGTQANTKVSVKPSWRIRGNGPIAATPAGGLIEVTLGPYDVLNLETDDGTLQDDPKTTADLTGTVVQADKPVAVFSGVESTSVPGSWDIPTYPGWDDGNGGESCCLDHLEEQMFPAESLGSKYVITRSPVRSTGGWREPDVLRFLGVAETAQVTTSLAPPYDNFTLNPGDTVTAPAQDNVTVTSTTPIMIGQLLVSQGRVQGPYTGDPSLTVFPPVDQFRTEYVILTPPSWSKNYVVISTPQGANINIDGAPTSGCTVEPAGTIDGVSYESRVCPLAEGAHRLGGDVPFGIVAYGYGSAGSYAFAGGADVKRIYEPPPIK
ncbi:MAG: IgGFc-binding protein [Myxococcales bacterium]|nr:IgGFc-binding protein [Myxococcales bacterium]